MQTLIELGQAARPVIIIAMTIGVFLSLPVLLSLADTDKDDQYIQTLTHSKRPDRLDLFGPLFLCYNVLVSEEQTMRAELHILTKKLTALTLAIKRQEELGIIDERKIALVEIYVELVGMLVEVLEHRDGDSDQV